MVLNDSKIVNSINNLFNHYDHLEAINDFINPKYDKLFIVIAEDMKDGIKLAELLSYNNRILPERNQDLSYVKNFIYNEIIENYYIYYSKETFVYIFVYPTNVHNEIMARYLTVRTIDSVKEFKVALTCKKHSNKDTLNSLFLLASNTLKNINWKHFDELEGNIVFLPFDIDQPTDFLQDASEYIGEYFNNTFPRFWNSSNMSSFLLNFNDNFQSLSDKEKLVFFVLGICQMNVFDDLSRDEVRYPNPQRILTSYYLKRSNNLMEISTLLRFDNSSENLKCLQDRILSMEKSDLAIETFLTNMSTLNISTYSSEEGELIEKFIISLCNTGEQFEIIRLICFMKYVYNISFYILREEILKYFAFYENQMFKNEARISPESQQLYKEILKIRINNKNLMMESPSIDNQVLNMEADVLCSPLENGTYKLQIKGKVLNFHQILYQDYCPGKITFLEVLALDKIIINRDLIKTEEKFQLIIIAPVWEIPSRRVINLDGALADHSWVC